MPSPYIKSLFKLLNKQTQMVLLKLQVKTDVSKLFILNFNILIFPVTERMASSGEGG